MNDTKKPLHKLVVFDSGIGGLSVLQELMKLPIKEFVYCADTAHVPYGDKTPDEIISLTMKTLLSVIDPSIDGLVLACHTASSLVYETITQAFPHLPVWNVMEPAARSAAHTSLNKRIGIIGTSATIAHSRHKQTILNIEPDAYIIQQACPDLVPLIEAPQLDIDATKAALHRYITPLLAHSIDTLIIGCTHYELIRNLINPLVGKDIALISTPPLMTALLYPLVENQDIVKPVISIHVTGPQISFLQKLNSVAPAILQK
ncbi:glutamate racemase [Candidatus Babeliales bacterium]|nr:glutamate racemase [Candidatus Babeliales bacterium]